MASYDDLASKLHTILKTSKKAEEEINEMVLSNDRDTRAGIAKAYLDKINQNGLEDDLKSKLTGDYEHFIVNAFRSPVEYDCHQIKRCLKGLNTDDEGIFEIIFTRPYWMIKQIMELYPKIYEKELDKTLEKEYSGDLGKCLTTILNTERSENATPDHKEAEANAKILYSSKSDKWYKTDTFNKIFAKCSPEELVLISRYYFNKTGVNILDECEKFPSKIKTFFKTLLYGVISPAEYFADRLKQSTKGMGTDTNLLERVLLTRCELDMELIRQYYVSKFKATPEEDIADDTSGNYKKLCIGLCNK